MHRILATMGFTIALTLSSAVSWASTVTLNYTGTVTFTAQHGMANVASVGDTVGGSVILNLQDTPIPGSGYNGSGQFTNKDVSYSGPGRFVDSSIASTFRDMTFSLATPIFPFNPIYDSFVLGLSNHTLPAAPLLGSLLDIPTNLSGIIAYLGATGFFSEGSVQHGSYVTADFYSYNFTVSTLQISVAASNPAVTPIPAALPLFASALGGLGFAGWRRKRELASSASC